MAFGSWKIEVNIGGYPQKVATAIAKLAEEKLGAMYKGVAYLGSQVANGINHAVLAEQTVLTGEDTKNAVILIFNEKPGDDRVTLVAVERLAESGEAFGGTKIDVTTDIPEDAKEAFEAAFGEGFVGSVVTPIALLGTQLAHGVNYIFAVEVKPVVENPESKVTVATVNASTMTVCFTDALSNKHEGILKYAFSWI